MKLEASGWIALFTEITIMGEIVLRDYDSGLTVPEVLWLLSGPRAETIVRFHYDSSGRPGLRWEPGTARAAMGAHDS